jgi:tetratricopeptide (TPR) repeat protein
MKKHLLLYSLIGMLALGCALPAIAWGPRVQLAVVDTALKLVSREENLQLTRLQDAARAGATLSPLEMEELFPEMQADPLRAIENDMALLSAARGARIDAYFAFRLGALGKLVGRATAPMANADPAPRSQYINDVEQVADMGNLKPETRKILKSIADLERVMREANAGNDLITGEYQSGSGFRGTAAARLGIDISRSVNAVADVWWTIISAGAVPGNISEAQLQRYVLDAYDFYVGRDSLAEMDASEPNYRKLVKYSADMNGKIGDMLYAAGFRERAVKHYEEAAAEAPDRRDILEKIGNYHSEVAEEALKKGLLEEAMAGFEKALAINLLHPTAERSRLEVAGLIKQRDEQIALYQSQLKQAEDLQSLAEEEAGRNRFAEAVALLKQSEESYAMVGDKFPSEAQRRARGIRDVRARIEELQQGLLTNTLAFSGTGFAPDRDALIREYSGGIDLETLKALIRLEYDAEIQRLNTQFQSAVTLE